MMKAIVIALDGSPGEIQQAMPHIRQLLEGHQPTGQAVFEAPTTVTDGGPGVTDAGPGVIDGGPTPGYPRLSDYVAAGGLISDGANLSDFAKPAPHLDRTWKTQAPVRTFTAPPGRMPGQRRHDQHVLARPSFSKIAYGSCPA